MSRRPAARACATRAWAEALETRVLFSHTPGHADPVLTSQHTYAQAGQFEFAVRFADADGVDPASLIGNNAAVSAALASDPTALAASYVSIDATTVGAERTVVYRATAPAGGITPSGTRFVVAVNADQVRDALGDAEPAATVGPLDVYELPPDLSTVPPGVPKNVRGRLLNVFTTGGREATTPLALRRVFADGDGDGAFDAGEAEAQTDLSGDFEMFAQPGTVVRAELSADWAPAGEAGSAPLTLRPNAPELLYSMSAPTVVDVLVAVAGVSTGPGFSDVDAIRQRVHDEIATANRFYANSDTNTVLNLVGVLPVWYPSNGLAKQDLVRLRNPRDVALDEIHGERDRLGADVVVLIPSAENARRDRTLGIAFQLSRARGDPGGGFAFVHSDSDPTTFAHEVGHVFGAGHERAIQKSGIRPYAHGLVSGGFVDVMAYGRGGEQVLPFFSTPRFNFNGSPIGVAATADNARVVREFAPLVASYRQPPVGGPAGQAPAVDLAVAVDARVRRPLATGAVVPASVRVTNVGSASAVGSVGFEVFLSSDAVLDDSDVRLGAGGDGRAALKSGKSKRFRFRFPIPPGLAAGSHQLIVRATGGPAGGEPNLSNNAATGPAIAVTA